MSRKILGVPLNCVICAEPVTLTARYARSRARKRGYAYCPPCSAISRGGYRDLSERIPKKDEKRFWRKVDKTTTPDGCWPWTGRLDEKGYGQIKINGRMRLAHHVALELAGFIIPAEFLQVRHYVCDFPPCCRHDHLRIGTSQDDADDKVSKGRQARVRGEHNGQAKLRQQDVDEIRRIYRAGGISQEDLGRQLVTISDIILGKTWRYVEPGEEL